MSALSASPSAVHTVLAFDFGTRRIGVAVGNTLTHTAQPLATLAHDNDEARFAAIARLIAAWTPAALVVGLPVHADGKAHTMTARAQGFARALEGRFGLPVALADERYTTEEARTELAGTTRSARHVATRDSIAAQRILERYFDEGPVMMPAAALA
jgi:putative Holliday junction resolvase